MTKPKKLFLVSVGAQRKELDQYCFGDCGKIGIGVINLKGGLFAPCREEQCSFCSAELDIGQCEIEFSRKAVELWHVIVRRLTWWTPSLKQLTLT